MHDLSKKAFVVLLSAFLAISLSACGRKPRLSDLEAPAPKAGSVVEAPQAAETLDGERDGLEPIAKTTSDRKFLLDFLL